MLPAGAGDADDVHDAGAVDQHIHRPATIYQRLPPARQGVDIGQIAGFRLSAVLVGGQGEGLGIQVHQGDACVRVMLTKLPGELAANGAGTAGNQDMCGCHDCVPLLL